MKRLVLFLIIILLFASESNFGQDTKNNTQTLEDIKIVLDAFHKAASDADFDAYFNFFDENAVFMGTDATERWQKKDFMVWAKPHFEKGKAWHFTAFQRHISIDNTGYVAWFDELLDTQMKICRGSGVLIKYGDIWKIQHYVLSMTVPNELADSVIKLKAATEDMLLKEFK